MNWREIHGRLICSSCNTVLILKADVSPPETNDDRAAAIYAANMHVYCTECGERIPGSPTKKNEYIYLDRPILSKGP